MARDLELRLGGEGSDAGVVEDAHHFVLARLHSHDAVSLAPHQNHAFHELHLPILPTRDLYSAHRAYCEDTMNVAFESIRIRANRKNPRSFTRLAHARSAREPRPALRPPCLTPRRRSK